jgi:hypothetical protein
MRGGCTVCIVCCVQILGFCCVQFRPGFLRSVDVCGVSDVSEKHPPLTTLHTSNMRMNALRTPKTSAVSHIDGHRF